MEFALIYFCHVREPRLARFKVTDVPTSEREGLELVY
jgi:hypothetical protein